MHVYGGAKHAFWAEPRHTDGSPAGGTTHKTPTVPGVGFHAAHAARAWRSVFDVLDKTTGAASVTA